MNREHLHQPSDFPWTMLHAHVQRTLRSQGWLPPQSRILIAVSGGQDSLCLLQLCVDLQPKWSWQLAVAHCDHQWRPDSTANAEHVAAWVHQLGLPFFSQTATLPPVSEAAARTWRYQVLQSLAAAQGYTYVLTGHTASDRAETLLYNLTRGTGMDGLQSLTWQRPLGENCTLIRPLLQVSRSQTAEFCQTRQLPVWVDTTNQDLHHARNRIRLEVIPYWQTHFNPQITGILAQTAEILTADVTCLEALATQLRQTVEHPNQPGLHRARLQSAELALQRRVIRQFLQYHLPTRPEFPHIEKVRTLLAAPHRSQSDPFPGGAIARVDQDWLLLIMHPI